MIYNSKDFNIIAIKTIDQIIDDYNKYVVGRNKDYYFELSRRCDNAIECNIDWMDNSDSYSWERAYSKQELKDGLSQYFGKEFLDMKFDIEVEL